ncbi:MAG: ABC transporter ATP-binding protein [Deltaproteobacteria bacterium]|nr:ABC transporter ATP-binding protein [Deltaproteobacteria bacterium]
MSSAKPNAIEMLEAGKRYGRSWVLSRLNVSIPQGETVALFGKNGSGKSTFIKLIATLLSHSTGSIKVLGLDAQEDRAQIRPRIRFLGHEKQLYDILTVRENLRLVATLLGIPSSTVDMEIQKLLEKLKIQPYEHRRISQLSEGNKKRVVLARLLLQQSKTDLYLLDEPHPTLDDEGRQILDGLIQDWQKQGKTILLSSHDPRHAKQHAHRLLVISDGTISYDGVPV